MGMKTSNTKLTAEMERVMGIAARDGSVAAGKGAHNGHVERVNASTILALIKRGLLVHCYASEGGLAGRLPDAQRSTENSDDDVLDAATLARYAAEAKECEAEDRAERHGEQARSGQGRARLLRCVRVWRDACRGSRCARGADPVICGGYIVRPLDPTWWRRVGTGYEQQDGAGRINRLKTRSKVTGWCLYVKGEYKGQWPTLGQTKRRAYQITGGVAPL